MHRHLFLFVVLLVGTLAVCARAQEASPPPADLTVSMIHRSEAGRVRTEEWPRKIPQYGGNTSWQVRIKLEHPRLAVEHAHDVRVRIVDGTGKVWLEFGGRVTVKANEEWHKKDLKDVLALNGADCLSTRIWPIQPYELQVSIDGRDVNRYDFAMVRPIDFPTDGRVFVKNLTGDGVRIFYQDGSKKKSFYLASNDQGWITDDNGRPMTFSQTATLTYRDRVVQINRTARWSEAKDGSCYWKLTIGGANANEDP